MLLQAESFVLCLIHDYFGITFQITTMSLSNKLSITDVDLKGKRVLIRVWAAIFPRSDLRSQHFYHE